MEELIDLVLEVISGCVIGGTVIEVGKVGDLDDSDDVRESEDITDLGDVGD